MSQMQAFYSQVLGSRDGAPPAAPSDEPYRGRGRAALAGGELVGLLTGNLLPDNSNPDARVLYLYGAVHPSWRRRGIGRRLLAGLLEEIRNDRPAVTSVVTLGQAHAEAAAAFLLQQGFSEAPRLVRYERELMPDCVPQDVSSLRTAVYRGGDTALEAAIIDLYHRGYRGRRGIPQLTGESIRRQLEMPGFAYMLIFDGDRLVGHGACYAHDSGYYVDSTVIVRSHWGSGASDALVRAYFRHALTQGCSRISGAADASNRASRALMERLGFRLTEQFRRFLRVLHYG